MSCIARLSLSIRLSPCAFTVSMEPEVSSTNSRLGRLSSAESTWPKNTSVSSAWTAAPSASSASANPEASAASRRGPVLYAWFMAGTPCWRRTMGGREAFTGARVRRA